MTTHSRSREEERKPVPRSGAKRGFLLTFEGIEGCGKTTQLRRLGRRLKALGYLVVETREPGGSALSEQIRAVVLNVAHHQMDPRCELFLYLASRAQHVADIIRPSLEKGAIVLCDRFADATVAYQGYGRALGASFMHQLNRFAIGGIVPDLTLLLNVPVALGLERKRRGGRLDRLDLEHEAFHRRVRDGYLRIAKKEPRRIHVVDGTATADKVAQSIARLVEQALRRSKTQLTRVEPHAF
jgi:dTMP kinase